MDNNAIKKIKLHKLQRLRDIELELPEVGVTAIVGVNGSGKSTVMRALACVFQPQRSIALTQADYKPNRFFMPYEGNDWNGSSYEVWIAGQEESRIFKKEDGSWLPLPISRFHRYVKLIGIGDSTPDIERESEAAEIQFQRTDFWDAGDAKLPQFLRKVGETLNRTYTAAGKGSKITGLTRFMYAALDDRALGALTYPSHYMGAGEQKIFEIVREVLQAPKGAFILIEEPEVSLHNKAMNDLLIFLKEQAEKKSLQIVISTHWLGIKAWVDKLTFFSLNVDPNTDQVTCGKGFTPADQYAISGDREDVRRLTVWVEDVLARSIVDHLANDLGVKKFIKKIGVARSAHNLFAVAAGLVIDRDVVDDVLIVGDGDRDTSLAEKQRAMQSLIDIQEEIPLGGPCEWVAQKRAEAVSLVSEFCSPEDKSPEEFFLIVARDLVQRGEAPPWLIKDLSEIDEKRPPPNGKKAFYELAKSKCVNDDAKEIKAELARLHARLIQAIAGAPQWADYVKPVEERLIAMCRMHNLIQPSVEVVLVPVPAPIVVHVGVVS
ncbi:MAG: AAA family ATPase [Burkholderiaceae bacterium]